MIPSARSAGFVATKRCLFPKNTLEILDNYLKRAVAENLNIVDVLDHIFAEDAKSKRKRAYEKQIQMSGLLLLLSCRFAAFLRTYTIQKEYQSVKRVI